MRKICSTLSTTETRIRSQSSSRAFSSDRPPQRALVTYAETVAGDMTALPLIILGFLAQGTGQPPEAPAPLAAPHPVLIHDDHDLNS
jgi:hypothetical protein